MQRLLTQHKHQHLQKQHFKQATHPAATALTSHSQGTHSYSLWLQQKKRKHLRQSHNPSGSKLQDPDLTNGFTDKKFRNKFYYVFLQLFMSGSKLANTLI